VVVRRNGSNGKKLLGRKLDAMPICVRKVTVILCFIVLSSEPNTRTCLSACLHTELPISVLFLFFSSFGVLLVPASPNTFLLNVLKSLKSNEIQSVVISVCDAYCHIPEPFTVFPLLEKAKWCLREFVR
jgi:hypothetical protein